MFFDNPDVDLIKEEGVWLYRNFISKEDCSFLTKEADKFSEEDWHDGWSRHQATLFYNNNPESEEEIKAWWEKKVSPPLLNSVMTMVNNKLKPLFLPELLFIPEYKIVRLQENEYMKPHKDDRSAMKEAEVKQQFKIICAYTLYLSEFTGGEITYPEIGYTHTPEPGDLVIHSGTVLHEVLPVKSGTRYTVTGWLLNK
jgi:predicted 2-oxoglutarate/Fe(II)-dependent dioxygenase YbiX